MTDPKKYSPIYTEDGEEYFDEEYAVADLLQHNVLFVNSRTYLGLDGNEKSETLVLFVVCNDTFTWATADAVSVTFDELERLYKMYIQDKKWGCTKWCCQKRNMQPLESLKKNMIKNDVWDEQMEKLPANICDQPTTL